METKNNDTYKHLKEVMNQMYVCCNVECKTKFEESRVIKACDEGMHFLEGEVNTFNTKGIRERVSRYGSEYPERVAIICTAWAEVMTGMKKNGLYDARNVCSVCKCEQFYLSYTRVGLVDFSGNPAYKNFVALFKGYYHKIHRTNCQTLTQVLFEGIVAGKKSNGMADILENAFGEDLEAVTRMPLI